MSNQNPINKTKKNGKFQKGEIHNPNGRPKGSKNKFTAIKEDYVDVFHELQKDRKANLKAFALKNPEKFYDMIVRMMPRDLSVSGGLELNGSLNMGDFQKSYGKYSNRKKR